MIQRFLFSFEQPVIGLYCSLEFLSSEFEDVPPFAQSLSASRCYYYCQIVVPGVVGL